MDPVTATLAANFGRYPARGDRRTKSLAALFVAAFAFMLVAGCAGGGGGGGGGQEEEQASQKTVTEIPESNILFQDDFSDTTGGWSRKTAPDGGVLDYDSDNYRMYIPPVSRSHYVTPEGEARDVLAEQTDMVVEVKAERYDPPRVPGAWGIVCRASASEGGYYFLVITDSGEAAIGKSNLREQTILAVTPAPSDTIHTERLSNYIRGECVGSDLDLYVNGEWLVGAQDTEHTTGLPGVYGESGSTPPGLDVRFDDFKVSKP